MKKTTQTLFFLASVFTLPAYANVQRAAYGHCGEYKDEDLKVKYVNVGTDNGKAENISIKVEYRGKPSPSISIGPSIKSDMGKTMFELLIAALKYHATLRIDTCNRYDWVTSINIFHYDYIFAEGVFYSERSEG